MTRSFKKGERLPAIIASGLVNRIIDISSMDIDPIDGHYLGVYEELAANPESKVVDLLKAHHDCAEVEINPDMIQEAYNNGERRRNCLL